MSILALSMSSCYLLGEKSELEAQEMMYVNQYNEATEAMTAEMEQNGSQGETQKYKQLQGEQQNYDSKKTTIESRLKVINSQIEGFQEAVKNNVKSECKLSISV